MIVVTNLEKSFGLLPLFEGVSLQLNAGARYGLVGANGSGKTTFLKILAGDEEATSGSVNIGRQARVGVLRQDRFLDDGEIILDLAMRGDPTAWKALRELHELSHAAEPGDPEQVTARMAALQDVLAATDGYRLEARAGEVLEGLGIPTRHHRQTLSSLSGGFKLRVLLAQVLLGGADVLLLDEPTNHLDILTIRWLERFLSGYTGCAVIISHDQRFLDNVTTHTLDVDYRTITLYNGNYAAFAVEKAAIRERKETAIARAEEEIARKKAFVERFSAKATKASQAQSRLKQIEKIEVEELIPSSRRAPALQFVPERPSGRDVLVAEGISKAYGEKRVLTDVSLRIPRGQRVAIIGENGLGKSTLLRILVERLAPDAGLIRWGHEVRIGYFPQDHREVLADGETTPLEKLWSLIPGQDRTFVRGQLGRVLFSGEDVDKKIRLLSGGESARLIFALLAVQKPNVLVLDEPTNHLDMESIQALVNALSSFTGTILFVSHDRWFVSQLATRVLELTAAGPRDFPGTYEEYLEKCGDDHLDATAVVERARRLRREAEGRTTAPGSAAVADGGPSPESWEEQKKRRNRIAKLPQLRDKVLADIEAAEARTRAIDYMFADPEFYRARGHEQADLAREKETLAARIEALMRQWEELEAELAAAAANADA